MFGNPYAGWERALERSVEYPKDGTLGYWIDGQFRIEVEGDPSLYWVRFGNNSFRAVPHKFRISAPTDVSTAAAQNIPVRLGFDNENEYSILDVDRRQGAVLFSFFGGAIFVGAHTHPLSDMAWIGTKSLTAGNILRANGTQFDSVPLSTIAGTGLEVSGNQLVVTGAGLDDVLVSIDGDILVSADGYILSGV